MATVCTTPKTCLYVSVVGVTFLLFFHYRLLVFMIHYTVIVYKVSSITEDDKQSRNCACSGRCMRRKRPWTEAVIFA